MTLTEFLLSRIAEDEAVARAEVARVAGSPRRNGKAYALRMARECEAKRRIVELHKAWPVLVETPPRIERDASDPQRITYSMTQNIRWMTEQKYREAFGSEPPTGPILCALALPYADHPDYDEAWRP